MRSILIFAIGFVLSQTVASLADAANENTAALRENDAKQLQVVNAGGLLLREHRPAEAIEDFDKVISSYETMGAGSDTAAYCGRSPKESLFYLVQAEKDKKSAIVLGTTWCDAYYLRAYALTELGRNDEARASLEQAVRMAPNNAHYRSELANLHASEKNWKEALAMFDVATRLAEEFSPEERRIPELGRALRGKGFVLVELGRLDEAEMIYRKCLEINPADDAAMKELRYVQSRRQQKQP
jgi:tetratricopeptide (TPR) repeat protein